MYTRVKVLPVREQYKCIVCGELGDSKTHIILHIELHLNIDHHCTKCDNVEKTRSDLKLHMFNAHKGNNMDQVYKSTLKNISNYQ